MRLFPGDFVPNLSVAPPEMLGPWVMPWYLPRRHKDRLWSLLVAGLHRFDDRLHFVELRWSERHYVEDGRIRLPRPVVVRLRGESLSSAEPAAIVQFANKWAPGTTVLDFDNVPSLQSFGWLGPFKVRVLYRVMDVLLDRPPIADTQPIVDVLQEAARLLLTPIELLDFAELMLERVAFGVSIEGARALAFGDALAARFESIYAVDAVTKVLGEAAGDDPSEPVKRALVRVGLVDGSTRLPLLDLVRDPEIRQRAIETFSRRMSEMRWEEESLEEKLVAPPRTVDQPDPKIELLTDNVAIASPLVRDALARILDDEIDAGTKLLIDALRDGTAEGFSKEDALVAGKALARDAFKLNHSNRLDYGGRADRAAQTRIVMLCEAAADYMIKGNGGGESLKLLILGGRVAHESNQADVALRLLMRAEGLTHENADPHLRGQLYQAFAKWRWKFGETAAAIDDLRAAAGLYAELGAYRDEANVRELLGGYLIESLMLQDAEVEIMNALRLYRKTPDSDIFDISYANELLGTLLIKKGEFDRADSCLQKAYEIYENVDYDDKISNVTACIGILRLRRGDIEGAKSAFEAGSWDGYKGLGDVALFEGNVGGARDAYAGALQVSRMFPGESPRRESSVLRSVVRLKFITNEPFIDQLRESEEIAAQIHDIHGIWLSKSLRAATLPSEEALPLLAECADFFDSKGMPWETCILRGLIALFQGDPAEQIQTILQPMLGTRAEVIASLVKAGRTKDAHHALLIELPTG